MKNQVELRLAVAAAAGLLLANTTAVAHTDLVETGTPQWCAPQFETKWRLLADQWTPQAVIDMAISKCDSYLGTEFPHTEATVDWYNPVQNLTHAGHYVCRRHRDHEPGAEGFIYAEVTFTRQCLNPSYFLAQLTPSPNDPAPGEDWPSPISPDTQLTLCT